MITRISLSSSLRISIVESISFLIQSIECSLLSINHETESKTKSLKEILTSYNDLYYDILISEFKKHNAPKHLIRGLKDLKAGDHMEYDEFLEELKKMDEDDEDDENE